MHRFMNHVYGSLLAIALAGGALPCIAAEGPFIVRDGKPNAQIVTAANPPRMVVLAAKELQNYIARISGAELPIVMAPARDVKVNIYVGASRYTKDLGISNNDLKYEAFRIVSGPDWLVLLGNDSDFEPKEPYAHSRSDQARVQKEWDTLTGATWLNPMSSMFRFYHTSTGTWFHDQGGSFNAVCDFLRTLGVRWYMPGKLGEVVPQMTSIRLPDVNKTVRPDSPLRRWFGAYFAYTPETWAWDRHLGMNSGYAVLGAGMHVHGMRLIQGRKELQTAHPEYYAIYGGQRDTNFRGTGHACFSSQGLVDEAVRFARAVFDVYDEPVVSLWPQDGFRQCQCDTCWPMTPSDNVWGFVDRVAREVYKTHPGKQISCGAYGSYRTPPQHIDTLSPNVLVFISAPRPGLDRPETWDAHWDLVQAWIRKTGPGRLIRNANNYHELVIHPHSFARELHALKGLSLGDWSEVRRKAIAPASVAWQTPGIDHLNAYVNARFLWDADTDLDALLDEYYRLFYGPAAEAMRTAFEYAEAHYDRIGPSKLATQDRIPFVELLDKARTVAGDTLYGQRVQLVLDELPSAETLRRQAQEENEGRLRPDAPLVVGREADSGPKPATYELKNIITAETPAIPTTFQVMWDKGVLVFNIRCHEPDMENLFVSKDIWGGDSLALVIETPSHAYYQIETNPDGDVFDADRQHGKVRAQWSSHIEVKTLRGTDFWGIEARIPVAQVAEGVLDPNNFVVGEKPSAQAPWYFNLGRVRIRNGEKTAYMFSPTGINSYHVPRKFARLEIQ